ncbi:DUF2508 family protein [Tissierella sp.]|uniref:DUF2508 family protein n=1 Tax=Tissierella sp. TaxID=41274 RepID=UPI00285552D4|nr:DUF2508 family protein [Tissierella sp.]MDR7857494.1 DUF2508 family protein [Tissierella sp.]
MLNFPIKNKEKSEMLENIRLAHKQWEEKINFFQSVTDPDLIDYAIFEMEASRLKYIYLFKQYKSELANEKIVENAIS